MEHSATATTPILRAATPDDVGAIERLLASASLPAAGVSRIVTTRPDDFVVADDPANAGELAAVAGLEVCCNNALLRSVAVRPEWRRNGLGKELVRRLVADAEARGLNALYLLTTTAEQYFPRFGFERIERADVPEDIARTDEFQTCCPSTAVVMTRALAANP